VHDLTGPTSPNGEEVAAILGEVVGHDVAWVDLEPDAHASMLREYGLPDMVVELVTDLARLAREGAGAQPTRGFERLTGRPPEDLVSWVGRHRGAFAANGSD
jgi:NAD(P)H dehydrogenase (quinone)